MTTENPKPPTPPVAAPPTIPPPPSTRNPPPPLPSQKIPTQQPNPRPYQPISTYKKRIHTPPPQRRSCFTFRCCFMWFLISIFILAAVVAAAVGIVWLLYRPQQPRFTIASLRMTNLNLTGDLNTDASANLYASGNLTISAKNPNSKISTFYDAIEMSTFSKRGVLIANASFQPFESAPGNSTVIRFVFADERTLDLEAAKGLRSDLSGKSEVGARIVMETRMGVQIGKWRTKRVGITVECVGVRVMIPKKVASAKTVFAPASAPAAATPVAVSDDGSCKVNLSIKVWGFVF